MRSGRGRTAQAASRWVGSSRKDLKRFPEEVQDVLGRALLDTQFGDRPADARPLKGFGGASVLEITEDFRGDTYRVVCTVRFPGAVYVLHAFKKKSKRGARTPRREMDLVRDRYRAAERHFREHDGGDGP
ncbi:MAG: addiction module toxin RelE [Gemmatimonas sp. SM23_52]|nr:MAG: addiction module toxin RelE [Gemmatimonas sp. SM23_52]